MVWSIQFIKYRENKLIVTTYVQNVRIWLRHKLASVLAIGQLYHQSVTAPRCTTQLRDVRGLPLPVRRSSKPVLCIFLYKFLFLFVSSSYQKIPESAAEHRSLLIFISFKSKCVFFSISLKCLPVIYLSLRDNDVMFTSCIKRVFILVYKYVKVIKIQIFQSNDYKWCTATFFMVHSVCITCTR